MLPPAVPLDCRVARVTESEQENAKADSQPPFSFHCKLQTRLESVFGDAIAQPTSYCRFYRKYDRPEKRRAKQFGQSNGGEQRHRGEKNGKSCEQCHAAYPAAEGTEWGSGRLSHFTVQMRQRCQSNAARHQRQNCAKNRNQRAQSRHRCGYQSGPCAMTRSHGSCSSQPSRASARRTSPHALGLVDSWNRVLTVRHSRESTHHAPRDGIVTPVALDTLA